MRNGHYTLGDISDIQEVAESGSGLERKARHLIASVDGYTLYVYAGTVDVYRDGKSVISTTPDTLPMQFRRVAKILCARIRGRGGKRYGAGRKANPNTVPKKVRSFYLTNLEAEKVKAFIANLRI